MRTTVVLLVMLFAMCTEQKPVEPIDMANAKILYLLRHAKSSWKDSSLYDFDRPLNKRGKRDAPFMGGVLKDKGVLPDLIISSPAKRAITTARKVAKEIGYPKDHIIGNENIYEASVSDLLDLINALDDSLNSAMLVGHNPTFTALANYLTDTASFDNVPTCGVVAIAFPGNDWKGVDEGTGKLLFFEYPKKYRKQK